MYKPNSPNTPPQENFGLNLPKPDDNNFSHAPASSPITPVVPQTPTTFTPTPSSPFIPAQPSTILLPAVASGEQAPITPDVIQKAQKYCKFATSALNYDDVKSAVENLHKALNLLQLGKEQ
ncbi:hypothetical protein NQ314_011269 [Rhamnusium bicolor]|uniref:Vta1 C-terminal domain-containing protein n=1 Tax=Rhamnusium bicolor TaxID=1586634 RepID=A0AAV8XLW9_9CUCU|nr:hypothetical protein NQ314_011269 [Rhamnusium bicolor]